MKFVVEVTGKGKRSDGIYGRAVCAPRYSIARDDARKRNGKKGLRGSTDMT